MGVMLLEFALVVAVVVDGKKQRANE